MWGIAENLAKYLLYGDINLINTEMSLHSISREEIRKWQKIPEPDQRLVLDYIPTLETVRIKPLRTTKIIILFILLFITGTICKQDRTQPKPGHPPVVNKTTDVFLS
jgi:hypothetical protein